jgi:hypothetical protein
MQMDESDEQPENSNAPRDPNREPPPNVTVERPAQFEKHSPQTNSTEEGTQIDESLLQPENAAFSRRESLESAPNVTEQRPQSAKHFSPKISTEEGTQIDESDEQQRNAQAPMLKSLQSHSNFTLDSNRFPLKQPIKCSIPRGIITDDSLPMDVTIEFFRQFTKKLSTIAKFKLPSSTEIPYSPDGNVA